MKSSHVARRRSNKHAPKVDVPRYVDLQKRLAGNVVRRRGELGLTQMQAAERTGLGWRHLQKVEAAEANATLATLAKLGTGLDIDPAELLAPLRKRGAR